MLKILFQKFSLEFLMPTWVYLGKVFILSSHPVRHISFVFVLFFLESVVNDIFEGGYLILSCVDLDKLYNRLS